MIEQLFGSKTRVKLLQMFYANPNRSFYVREITRKIDEQINSVRRELANLLNIGIISSETTNNKLYYEVNQTYEHYKALASIFGGAQKMGVEKEDDTDELSILGHVDLAILTGQFTRDDRSGVDFLVVGDINPTQVNKYISELERKEGKEIRFAVMPTSEYQYRLGLNDRFIINVLESKRQVLVDKISQPKPSEEPESVQEQSVKKAKKEKK